MSLIKALLLQKMEWYKLLQKLQAIVGTAFVRFVVNNTVVYEGHTVSGTYRLLVDSDFSR